MSVSIRLKRLGRAHLPFYTICVFPTLVRRDGNPIEELGFFNPAPKGKQESLRLDLERAKYWLAQGAKPSEIVAKIFRDNGLKGDLWARKPHKNKKRKIVNKTTDAAKTAKSAKTAKKIAAPADAAAPKAKKRKPRTANSKLTATRKQKAATAAN